MNESFVVFGGQVLINNDRTIFDVNISHSDASNS
jgi:hypothetical protein